MSYNVGDIVKKTGAHGMEYHIVIDLERVDKTYWYEIMQMYPVASTSRRQFLPDHDLMLVAEVGDINYATIIGIIEDKRDDKGFEGRADYWDYIEVTKALEKYRKYDVKPELSLPVKDDIIEYHKLESRDMCLDALNDLDALHKMFGDEAYLQLKEVVIKRLDELK
ncbi:hypothetical protein Kirov_70 [Bacillus phage Kirov]|uniref:Uncharacterized protein n=1 Tax=Bacillus phage Kirov TaxID=2783539 RepID=A0A7U3RX05_9CAUD|nr:hypothetical protein PQE67_gp234 [Bacillus phage Kirov]QOV08269.1 hypothetical protein Kirov_70 [Bacillus phage Kirov]